MPKRKPADAFQLAERMSRPLDRLQWLLEFARRKFEAVAALKDDSLEAVQDELRAFVAAQLKPPAFATAHVRRLTPGDIWRLCDRLSARINAAVNGSPAGGRDPGLPRRLTRDETGAFHVRPDSANVEPVFLGCAFDLVAAEGARIAKCARHNCDNLLVREGRSTYCSSRCSQYTRTMKHRRKQQNEAEDV